MADHSITLTPARQADGTIQWTMNYDGKIGTGPGTYPPIDLAAKEAHKLTYTIANPAGLSINFDPSMVQSGSGNSIHNALWVQPGTKPPTAVLSDQIKKVTVDPTVLTFKDSNTGTPVTLIYQINFVDAGNQNAKVTALDPELKNGGGNTVFVQSPLEVAAIAVSVAIVAFFAFRFFTRNRNAAQRPTT